MPARKPKFDVEYKVPALDDFKALLDAQPRGISTTMAFTRVLNTLLKDKILVKQLYQSSQMKRVLLVWKGYSAKSVFIIRMVKICAFRP
ncbi:pyruvate dehydrogenase E1 component [Rodentibacter pneumotropicus]|uniref:Pyruvate dehydrogenase E1 component n=1 Tax=Rodentibacter pneumotropicus TaxID=758 RepID=A0A3S4Y2Y0_9PAST|nr:pyruvate dehydrogenase E1 component [Rodentibacter pneumotropicus]